MYKKPVKRSFNSDTPRLSDPLFMLSRVLLGAVAVVIIALFVRTLFF